MNTSSEERRSALSNEFGISETPALPPGTVTRIGLVLMLFGGSLLLLSPTVAYLQWAGHAGVKGDPLSLVACALGLLIPGLLLRASTVENLSSVGQKIPALYRGLGIFVLNAVVIFGLLDLGARLLYELRDAFVAAPKMVLDPRSKSPYYRSKSWAPQYWREFAASRTNEYKPHVLWRRAPARGETINIDA